MYDLHQEQAESTHEPHPHDGYNDPPESIPLRHRRYGQVEEV